MKQNIFNGLVPMMAVFMLLTIWPTNANAKKIKYSEQIVYNGKVDANGQPNGEGTLTTTYGEYKNILEGFFNNGVVSNATLRLRVYDKKYEYFHYNGDVEFAVIDNKSVSYTIKGGNAECDIDDKSEQKLYHVRSHQLTIDSDEPFHILTTPDASSCHVQSDSISEWFKHDVRKDVGRYNSSSGVKLTSTEQWFRGSLAFKYAEVFRLGWIAEVKTRPSLRFNDKFKLVASENPLISVKGDNGAILQVHGDTISLSYPNGDYCKCYGKDIDHVSNGTITALKKTFNDGVLGCKRPGVVTFTDNKTNKTGTVVLKDTYKYGTYGYKHIHPLNIFGKNNPHMKFYDGNFLDNSKVSVFYGKAGEAIDKLINEEPKGYLDFGAALIDEGKVEEAEYWINKAINSGLPEARAYVKQLKAKAEEEAEKERTQTEEILQTYKQRAIQNKDKVLSYDIAYGYENGGEQQISIFEEGQIFGTIKKCTFVQNDDSAMVWYKKCVAYGNDPTKSDKPNLYKAYKRIEQLRSIIGKYEKLLPKYTKKYGQSAGTSLFKGRFVDLSFAAVNEFVRDLNSAENKYVLKAYEPTVGDVLKYGRGVKNYTLFSTGTFAINLTEFKVLNGKVIAQRNDYYGGMEELIRSYKESLDIYRGEGWIRRLDRINNK